MIDFRYHMVSLIAVFLAVALGIVIGAFIAMSTAVFMSPAGDVLRPLLADRWHAFLFWLTGLFT